MKHFEEMTTNEKIRIIEENVDESKIEEAVAERFLNDYESQAYAALTDYVCEKYEHVYRDVLLDYFAREVAEQYNSEVVRCVNG